MKYMNIQSVQVEAAHPQLIWLNYYYLFSPEACRKRGCPEVVSVDGLWKLSYPIW